MKFYFESKIINGFYAFGAMLFLMALSPALKLSGIDFKTISLGMGIYYVIKFFGEVPTGAFADTFGQKKSTLLGFLISAAGTLVLYQFSFSKSLILFGFALYAVGFTLVSGAMSSLLYTNVKEHNKNFNSSSYFLNIENIRVIGFLGSSLILGFSLEYFGVESLFFPAIIFLALILYTFIFVKEVDIKPKTKKKFSLLFDNIKLGFYTVKKNNKLKTLAFLGSFHESEKVFSILWYPWLITLGGDARWATIMATGSYLARYLSTKITQKFFKESLSVQTTSLSILGVSAGSLLSGFFYDNIYILVLSFWIQGAFRGIYFPSYQTVMHDSIPKEIKATGISFINFATFFVATLGFFVNSYFVDKISISTAFFILTGLYGFAGLVGLLQTRSKPKAQSQLFATDRALDR